jgi:hypothetical protein
MVAMGRTLSESGRFDKPRFLLTDIMVSRLSLAFVVSAFVVMALGACKAETRVDMFVDGFQPKNVRFETEDLGTLTTAQLRELDKRPDVDGVLYLPEGTCGGPCKAAMVSVFVHNLDADAKVEAAPVIRLKTPPNRERRLPIAFRGGEIEPGRIGRIRWVVEMWPEEQSLTATLSSSVQIVESPEQKGAPVVAPVEGEKK